MATKASIDAATLCISVTDAKQAFELNEQLVFLAQTATIRQLH